MCHFSTAPGDYTSTTQILTFSPTNTRSTASIFIRDDNVNEALEQFFASLALLSGSGNIQFSPRSAVIMIADDDGKKMAF